MAAELKAEFDSQIEEIELDDVEFAVEVYAHASKSVHSPGGRVDPDSRYCSLIPNLTLKFYGSVSNGIRPRSKQIHLGSQFGIPKTTFTNSKPLDGVTSAVISTDKNFYLESVVITRLDTGQEYVLPLYSVVKAEDDQFPIYAHTSLAASTPGSRARRQASIEDMADGYLWMNERGIPAAMANVAAGIVETGHGGLPELALLLASTFQGPRTILGKTASAIIPGTISNEQQLAVGLVNATKNFLYSSTAHLLSSDQDSTRESVLGALAAVQMLLGRAIPVEERWTGTKVTKFILSAAQGAVVNNLLGGNFLAGASSFFGSQMSFKSIEDVNSIFKTVDAPKYVSENWMTDEEFGRQMLASVAPNHIMCIADIPEKFGGGRDAVAGMISTPLNQAGLSLDEALAQGRVFMLDYEILEGIKLYKKGEEQRYCHPAMCLLLKPEGSSLVPVAIQLQQAPSKLGVITPPKMGEANASPSWEWLAAKAAVQCSMGNVHEMVTHALLTHLVAEPVKVALMRSLSMAHPVFKMLKLHLQDTIEINDLARATLINRGGVFDRITSIGGPDMGHMQLARKFYKDWVLQDSAVPTDFAKRGVMPEDSTLDDYPYREDAFDIWDALREHNNNLLAIYYPDDAAVAEDQELQNFIVELKRGLGEGRVAEVQTVDALAELITIVGWLAGPQHAAVNFLQYDHYAFTPNAPLLMRTEGPVQKGDFSCEKDFLDMLPTKEQAILQMGTVYILSRYQPDEDYLLGAHFERIDLFTDEFAKSEHRQFQTRLRGIEAKIIRRNRRRTVRYEVLKPSQVPMAITI